MITFTDQMMKDTLTTAWECGSDYWIADEDVRKAKAIRLENGDVFKIELQHNVDGKGWKKVEVRTLHIRTVLNKILKGEIHLENVRLRKHFLDVVQDEGWHCDADQADILLQFAVFGETVYG